MKIIYKNTFVNRLANQIDFITKDNPAAARKFQKELLQKHQNPLSFRKSIYFNDNSIRDLIFKAIQSFSESIPS